MCPDLFGDFGPYRMMILIGVLLCFTFCGFLCKKLKIDPKFTKFFMWVTVIVIIGGFCFAGLFQSVYRYIEDPSQGFNLNAGITFYGGLIGGTLIFLTFYFWIGRKYNSKLKDIMSIIAVMITIAHAFGRIGCFLAGCCYGKQTDSWIGVQFPFLDYKVVPTQLIEACFLFILFAVLLFLILKYKFKYGLELYAITYGVFRFIIEFFRGDARGALVTGISPSQFWSIVAIVVGVVVWILRKKFIYDKETPEEKQDNEEKKEDDKKTIKTEAQIEEEKIAVKQKNKMQSISKEKRARQKLANKNNK